MARKPGVLQMRNEELGMSNGKKADGGFIYSLMPLDEFKAVMGADDREDKICRFCLVTATLTIEQYCMRRFLRKKHSERIGFYGDELISLSEYPVSKVISAYQIKNEELKMKNEKKEERREKKEERQEGYEQERGNEEKQMKNEGIIDSALYRVIPECGSDLDIPYSIEFFPVIRRLPGLKALKIIYQAGYALENVPADLAVACMELAAWNMNRYRSRRIGMTGNVRGTGRDGEHFELSMPSNVRGLLETYKRKVI